VGAGAPILTRSRGTNGTGGKSGRLILGLLLATVILLIILAAAGAL
jgi:hypothetical protein